MKANLIKTGESFLLKDVNNETLAITSGTMQGRMLSLKNCQAIERGYDLDELAEEFAKNHSLYPTAQDDTEYGFKHGFQKALELMSDKKFSEDDVISMIEKSRETGLTAEYLILTKQQTEWDVEIEMDAIPADRAPGGWDRFPKLDSDDCLILKRI